MLGALPHSSAPSWSTTTQSDGGSDARVGACRLARDITASRIEGGKKNDTCVRTATQWFSWEHGTPLSRIDRGPGTFLTFWRWPAVADRIVFVLELAATLLAAQPPYHEDPVSRPDPVPLVTSGTTGRF